MVELPTQEYLLECFNYDSETGKLFWKKRPLKHFKNQHYTDCWNTRFANTEALTSLVGGYKHGTLNGKRVRTHRVIYKLITGDDPDVIDHSFGDTQDNRFENITNGSQQDNMKNCVKRCDNSSGVTGVSWSGDRQKWVAMISDNGKYKSLGRFATFEEAVTARKQAEIELKYHPNHGRDK